MKISLYECFNARTQGDKIYCSKGHHLGAKKNGKVEIIRLKRGEPLVYAACQGCVDFEKMGQAIEPEDRGWS